MFFMKEILYDFFFLQLNLTGKIIFILFLVLIFFAGIIFSRIFSTVNLKKERADAVKKSRSVLAGQFGEQIAPFFPDFPCNPGDAKFLGKPVDFIAFPGSAEGSEIKEILFIEVKSGEAEISKREREIKNAVKNGKVRYVEYRLPF